MVGHRYCIGILRVFAAALLLPLFSLGAQVQTQTVTVTVGQSLILDFPTSIKRISLANPELIEATVVSPRQVLVNGKALGSTSVIVWDEGENYKIYKVMVAEPSSGKQIMLYVRFAEVDRKALREFGINLWAKNIKTSQSSGGSTEIGVFSGKVNTPNDPFILNEMVDLFFKIPQNNISSIIRALEERNLLKTLAKPTLSAIDNGEASFLAGGEVPVPVVSGSGIMQSVTITYKEFGIKLKFQPHIIDSSLIKIKVNAEVSSLDYENGVIMSGFRIPALITRRAETTVELAEGKFLIIGGLLNRETTEKISGLPFISKIPVLGILFGSRRYQNKETELLILLSPEIARPVDKEGLPAKIRSLKN
ncbi:MAG: pilus assembly protein N-terminal domain-containing protein [candidate division KSB1 bacterium]|nr:pilus assembly protein N-terminal domain-containing protein [candidate division KSB1 bacterium]